MSDDLVREWILSEGKATEITRISSVGGGCINRANRYDTDAGSFFVKTNRSIGPSMFEGEALGLNAMYETKSIRVPKPFKVGSLPTGGSYIIMEFIEFGGSRGDQSVLGRKLAEMHKAGKSENGFGFDVDNTIGSTPQINTWTSDWFHFYGEHRLGFQLKLLRDQYGDSSIYEKGQRLVKSMGPLFDDVVIEPCLLHGDLWSGNISSDKNGEPVILDPACYYGHNEAEFGMSWCAGFGGSFYDAYFKVMPKQPGFSAQEIQKATSDFKFHYYSNFDFDWYVGILNDGRQVLVKRYKNIPYVTTTDEQPNAGPYRDTAISSLMSNHSNALKLLGSCLELPIPMLVYEYAEIGPLNARGGVGSDVSSISLSWEMRLKVAKDIANVRTRNFNELMISLEIRKI
ncbi:hypothetical protein TIFTF001_041026 [Ficus carica]|uniref:Protein-ribulosamine 3-kinase, chloroplastic n=1 Tax=Ficus carica TaxID=3494 RepID=A0AA88CRN3_FICCA|nr:hypothetical protein TIFTF001_041026 [Ficus carica]